MERIINRRMDSASIGFGAQLTKGYDIANDNPKIMDHYFANTIPKDLVEYGMIPEFIGRFPIIVSTNGLNIQHLMNILTEPKNSIMKQYQRLFDMEDVKFHITQQALEEIANTAFVRGTGARGLRSIVDKVLMETQFVLPSLHPPIHTVYVDEYAVRGATSERTTTTTSSSFQQQEQQQQHQEEEEKAKDGNERQRRLLQQKPILLRDPELTVEQLQRLGGREYCINNYDKLTSTGAIVMVDLHHIMEESNNDTSIIGQSMDDGLVEETSTTEEAA